MPNHEPKAIVRRYYEEIGNQRRLDVADELFAPDFRLFPYSTPPYGPEGVKQFITWLCIDTFPDLRVTIENLVAEDENVTAFVTLNATHSSAIDWLPEIGTIAPTDKRFALQEFVLWHVVGGKIVERKLLVGTWEMLEQLGALPAPKNEMPV